MPETITVTSPFVDLNSQLFYEASYNKQSKRLSLKIFNHRGVFKNKRTLLIQEPVADLFTAEEYLIGMNQNHHRIFIFDVRQHLKWMVTGQLNPETGMTENMRKNKEKFSFFFYNREQPLIYGVFDQKHVFYFRINNVSQYSNPLINSKKSNQFGKINSQCEIGRIHTSSQVISKLQVQYKERIVKSPQSPKKKSVILEPIEDQQILGNPKQENGQRKQKVTYLYLLIKEKRQMRILSVIWESSQNNKMEVDPVNKENIYDFCFRNGWDLVLLYKNHRIKGSPKKKPLEEEKIQLITTYKGQYESEVKLSGNHQIFCSNENLFIIDPDLEKIIGVYNKEYLQIQQCASIPHSISPNNTMLMISRPDHIYLSFIFNVFNTNLSQFKPVPVMVPLYEIEDTLEQEQYLKKNIEKVFAPNGLIHPHFIQKVYTYLEKINRKHRSNSSSEKESEEKEIKSKISDKDQKNDKERDEYLQNFENPSELAKEFLNKVVMKESNLLYRVIFTLCNYGQKVLFEDKSAFLVAFKQKSSENSSQKNSSQLKADFSSQKSKSNKPKLSNTLLKEYHCNFDTWNKYFQEIIFNSVELLSNLCEENNRIQQRRNDSSIYKGRSQMGNLYEKIDGIQQKLVLLSNVYKRFSNLLQISQNSREDGLNSQIRKHQQKVSRNLNIIHSLFLIYNLFKLGYLNQNRNEAQKSQIRVKKAIKNVFTQFSQKRKQNINQFKQNVRSFLKDFEFNPLATNMKQSFYPAIFMPHQYFNSSKQLPLEESNLFAAVLGYLLSNLTQFEEVAYFYFLIRKELNQIITEEKAQQSQIKMKPYNQRSAISAISQKSKANNQNIDLLYPYMSEDLIDFFEGLYEIEKLNEEHKSDLRNVQLQINIVRELQNLSMKINATPFKLYMIQLCSHYKLPALMIELINSIKIQPQTASISDFAQPQSQENQLESKISKAFVEQETFFIKSFVQCGLSLNNHQNSITLRTILFYLIKRILSIRDHLLNRNIYNFDDSYSYWNQFQNESQKQNLNHQTQSNNEEKKDKNIPNSVKLKHHLFQFFIQNFFIFSNRQNIRELEELKRECLTLEEDKEFFQNVIDKLFNKNPK